MKLYGARDTEDDVIGASLLTFADNAIASELADSWFFIRYADPDPHVRLRFHGVRDRLVDRLFRHVCDWADGLMSEGLCLKFVFDAYEQEVERFGGAAAMTAAEALFFADSRAAARLIRVRKTHEWPHDQIALAVVSVDDLLTGLGLDEQARLRWYRAQTSSADPDVGAEYRERKNLLRMLLGDAQELVQTARWRRDRVRVGGQTRGPRACRTQPSRSRRAGSVDAVLRHAAGLVRPPARQSPRRVGLDDRAAHPRPACPGTRQP